MLRKKSVYISASEERLEKLVKERMQPKANKEIIDQKIWDLFGEYWCVLFTDLSGFSRNVEKFGIIQFLQTIYEADRLLVPIVEDYEGIILKSEGDSYLIIYRNVVKAVKSAIAMQNVLSEYNSTKESDEQVLLCIGIGYGKILRIGDSDVYGEEVNKASKLGEDTAKAHDILVTSSLCNELSKHKKLTFKVVEFDKENELNKEIYRIAY